MKRVVVTGLGLVTPLGCGVDQNWSNLISGLSGGVKISKFDPTNFKCKVACEVQLGSASDGKFNPEEWIEKKEIKKIDEFIQFSMAASDQAFRDSKIEITSNLSSRAGCIIGSGIGGLPGIEKTSIDYFIDNHYLIFSIVALFQSNTCDYLVLNETGSAIWNALKTQLTLPELCKHLEEEYEVTSDECKSAIETWLEAALEKKVIAVVED